MSLTFPFSRSFMYGIFGFSLLEIHRESCSTPFENLSSNKMVQYLNGQDYALVDLNTAKPGVST